MRLSRLSRPAAALAAAALLAGCGGSSGSSGGSADGAERLSPVAAVRAAAGTTAEAGSSRFEVTSSTDVDGQSFEFSGTGEYDPATRTGSASFELPGGMGTMEQRFIGDDLYLAVPGQPGFYQLSVRDLVGTELETAAEPTGGLEALEGLTDDVEEVGQEQVRGDDTTHYRGSLDADKALERLGGALRDSAAKVFADSGVETLPFEIWIDDEGRVRRFRTTVEVPASEVTGGQAVTSTTTIELFDFGVDVAADPPPADQVQDGAPLLDALRGQAPVG